MSRAAAATATKGAQKAALKEKADQHAADLAMGLTSSERTGHRFLDSLPAAWLPVAAAFAHMRSHSSSVFSPSASLSLSRPPAMKKLMAADTLLCTACSATQLGPKTKCECPGGKTKPAADYDAKHELLAAAMAREKARKDQVRGASAAQQGAVQAAKAKNKAEKDNVDALAALDLSALDHVDVAFEAGSKLGMSIEKNCVCAVAEGGAAEALKVKRGWVIRNVNGETAGSNKAAIMKQAAKAMKEGRMVITFQTPLDDGTGCDHYCTVCDKFIEEDKFEGATNGLDAGPGKQVCYSCEEYADMFG